MLAAIGAPADLMEWAYRCGLEEIEHTRICFALAAGYGGRSHSVKPMPDLLLCGLDMEGDPVVTLATESLKDGCQLEEFNADVAFACEAVCKEPATRFVLEQIAREERGHAAFSWAVLEYLYERNPEKVRPAIETSLREIDSYRRPTAFSWEKKRLVEKADPELMLKHGRLPDEEWAKMWDARLIQTKTRLQAMLNEKRAA
ncbi:MAG: hypothetical protein EB060_02450 [Proteobacteria bacterium]|nr:hypothetical protein [Pseudomonadota bacterium]